MNEVSFHGTAYAGSVEFAPHGVTVFACPASEDAIPHMASVCLDPTPDQAEAISRAFAEWAALIRSRQHANDPLPLLALMGGR